MIFYLHCSESFITRLDAFDGTNFQIEWNGLVGKTFLIKIFVREKCLNGWNNREVQNWLSDPQVLASCRYFCSKRESKETMKERTKVSSQTSAGSGCEIKFIRKLGAFPRHVKRLNLCMIILNYYRAFMFSMARLQSNFIRLHSIHIRRPWRRRKTCAIDDAVAQRKFLWCLGIQQPQEDWEVFC